MDKNDDRLNDIQLFNIMYQQFLSGSFSELTGESLEQALDNFIDMWQALDDRSQFGLLCDVFTRLLDVEMELAKLKK